MATPDGSGLVAHLTCPCPSQRCPLVICVFLNRKEIEIPTMQASWQALLAIPGAFSVRSLALAR